MFYNQCKGQPDSIKELGITYCDFELLFRYTKVTLSIVYFLLFDRVSRSFFRRLLTKHPELIKKKQKKVEVNRGLNCTRAMAVEYLDELAVLLNENGIANLTYEEPGVWSGPIDTRR